ncbi:MAG TPA: MFS transporter [Kofleriaceae bacterium]|nr:MFS transporter [Kofleriaceae bacterium]
MPSERRVVALLAAVQFANILDFMMVLPLGPDFAVALGIPSSRLGLVASAYTAAASVTGLIGAFVLDRFDRRRALLVALAGLALGTLSAAFARGFTSMMVARVVAGAFGGPCTSLVYSILSDLVPPARRGRAVGTVMAALSIASVLGVPAGLFVAQHVSWHAPFVSTALLIAAVWVAARAVLPPMSGHVEEARKTGITFRFVLRPLSLATLGLQAVTFLGMFMMIPFMSPYLQFNLGFSRDLLPLLYMGGGVLSFFTMRLGGWAVDTRGATVTALVGSLLYVGAVICGFAFEPALLPVPVFFALLMMANSARMVASNTIGTRIPLPAERARYMSVASSIHHLATTSGAVIAGALLAEGAGGRLIGMSQVAWIAVAFGFALPLGMAVVEPWLRRVEKQRGAAVTLPPAPPAA